MQEPKFLRNKQFKLLGSIFFGNPFLKAEEWSYDNEIGKLWSRFMKLLKQYSFLLQRLSNSPTISYELHLEPDDYKQTKEYYVMVAIEVNDGDEVPLDFFIKSLPMSDFLVFTTRMATRQEQGTYIFQKWMPTNNVFQRYPFILQRYDPMRYRGLEDPTSEIDWLIPIYSEELKEDDHFD